jgi:hypothetical protein
MAFTGRDVNRSRERAGILSGVDFRGQRGYVVAPPSVHPDGHQYRRINALHDELAPAPHWFIQLLFPERRSAAPESFSDPERME